MKEELNTKQHSEFSVSERKEIEHKAYCVWTLLGDSPTDEEIKNTADSYGITFEQAMRYKDDYFALRSK